MIDPTITYRLKPVFELPQHMDLPVCMYRMKNPVACITKTTNHTDDEKKVLASIMAKTPLPEMAALEARWDSIIRQFEEIKSQVSAIRKTITVVCKTSGCPIVDNETLSKLKSLQGAVISACPTSPPYSLLLLQHLYNSTVPIIFSTHVHSNVTNLPENLNCFSKLESPTNNALKLHLIWKNDILDTELVINPVKQLPIKGECNILRLFAQFGLKLLCYPSEDLISTLQTDSVLDLCHRLLHVKTSKEKASLYKSLNAKLGRSQYFGGDNINISDISAWSALKQINVDISKDLSPSIAKWYKRVDNMIF